VLIDACLVASLAVAGTIAYDAHHRLAARGDARFLPRDTPLALTARVVETRPSPDGPGRAVVAPLRASVGDGATLAVSGLVWVSWPDAHALPLRGDVVELSGRLGTPRGRRNPGDFDFASYLKHRRILSVMRCDGARVERRAAGLGRAQGWIVDAVRRRLPADSAALMVGLLLGRTGELPGDLMEAFRRSGTVHILSVSGLHVGFILLMTHALLRSARVPPAVARLLSVPFLLAFAALIGPRPSVLRATTMASVVVASGALGRARSALNAVGVAALAIVALDPGSLMDTGFRLSYGATLGIVLLYDPLARLIPSPRVGPGSRMAWAADALRLSTSAQLAVAPVLIATTGQFAVAAAPANLIVVPLAAFSVACGVAMLAADALPWLASLFAGSAWASLTALSWAARLTGERAWSTAPVAARFAPAALLGVVALGLLLRGRRPRVAGLAVAAVATSLAFALATRGPGRDRARIVFFDVGQGDAALIELPGRRYVLVDAGPAAPWMRYDAGSAVIRPYLQREAVTTLEALVLTHGHDDHTGGAPAVLAGVRIRRLVLPEGWERSAPLARAAARARAAGARIVSVARGDSLRLPGVDSLFVLGPPREAAARGQDENDASVVLLLRVGRARALLTGDAGRRVEELSLARGDPLAADVLKVAHHGSATSSSGPYLDRAAPGIAVVSVGERNRFGHPDAGVLGRLRACGAAALRTDLEGAVLVWLRGDSLRAEGVASGRRVAAAFRDVRTASRDTMSRDSRKPRDARATAQGTRDRLGPTTTSE